MVQRKVLISLFLSVLFFNSPCIWAEEKFPFLAETNTDKVNVRSGQNTNFEKMASLDKGEAIVVLGQDFDWYKIQVPAKAKVYIRQDYAALEGKSIGTVTGTSVNVRSGAGTNFTSVGQLKKGDKIQIVDKSGEWLQIAPQEGMVAWVKKDFVAFKTADATLVASASAQNKSGIKSAVEQNPMAAALSVKTSGQLGAVESGDSGVAYALTNQGQTLYYLKSAGLDLSYFFNNQITVEGRVVSGAQTPLSVPVLSVSKVMLVL